jgi:hypothetical protein
VVLLVVVFFVLGLVLSALWFHPPAKSPTTAEARVELSDGTKALLEHLAGPIEVRFYSILDPGAPLPLRAFSGRVDRLLSAYEEAANGKIVATRHTDPANPSPNNALADGIKPFDLDKGEGSYLGLALSRDGKKEVLSQLSPEWEPALESDLSRAIARLAETAPKAATTAAPADAAALEEVKHTIPDIASVSLEDGTRTLREAALKEFTTAVNEMQAQVREAQVGLEQAQKSGSAAEQESAMKHLQEVQTAQGQKLKQIASKSQAQIEALKQLKANGK